ncbi:hypothetical protein [Porphyrobacter sp. AAP60]|uniref:hypothetical protein n=1 Tax=Porphyrobacter sp. AAP60 TaxID=1523423 RepID=UPI0006B8E94F|nr:hypothetical protein [Porphyrobacter sp. AAP60]
MAAHARLVPFQVDASFTVPSFRPITSNAEEKDIDMKQFLAATAAMVIAVAAPAVAQQGVSPGADQALPVQTGTVIYGSDGAEVGTVADKQGDIVVLKVGERMVPIGAAAISGGADGPKIALTRASLVEQFDTRVAAYEAELDAAVKAGAPVQTADNQQLGTIQGVSDNAVAIQSDAGPMTLPKTSLALTDQGTVIVRATMAQIEEAMRAQSQSR